MRFPKLLSVTYILIAGLIVLSIPALHGQQHQHDSSCCSDTTETHTGNPDFQRCGSTLYRNLEESRNPEIREIRERLEKQTRIWLDQHTEKSQILNEVITIPVVVHVVYNRSQPEQNISDEQILSQIEALNADFRRINSDTINTPELFRNLTADTYIEFQLARRTPDGLPTNGITRTATDVQEFSFESDNIKYDNTGGKNIWNRDRYMNIWVCNMEQNYLGYAQYPGGNAATDGIVISYRNFGTTGTVQFPFNLGRTVTHEVGHWLNLVHTWGDEDNCNATDYVADTPNQESAHYHCPGFPQISCDSEDMFMNYMDYTDDRCMNLFTAGQSHRMHATLNGFRASIKNSDALVAPEFTNLVCDTLNRALKSAPLYLYLAGDGGYATGTNAYNDKAKAQYFENTGEYTIAKGGAFAFGAAHDKGGTAYAAIWE
ncbi:MAG: zinc metalloprotease, partial [Bacteroidales bacterium]|nr:zinc metalloprotease [Bacteroidales bacterium]